MAEGAPPAYTEPNKKEPAPDGEEEQLQEPTSVPAGERPAQSSLVKPTLKPTLSALEKYSVSRFENVPGVEVGHDDMPLYRHRKPIFATLAAGQFFFNFAWTALSANIENFEDDIGINSSKSGIVIGLPQFLLPIIGFAMMGFCRNLKITVGIPITMGCMANYWLITAVANRYWIFVANAVFATIGYASFLMVPVLIDHMAPASKRSRYLNVYYAVGAPGVAAGFIIGGGKLSWRTICLTQAGVFYLLTVLAVYFLGTSGIQKRIIDKDTFGSTPFTVAKTIIRKRAFLIAIIANSGVWSPMAGWATFGVKWFNKRFYAGTDDSMQTPSMILGLSVVGGTLWMILGGMWLDRLVKRAFAKHGKTAVHRKKIRVNTAIKLFMVLYPLMMVLSQWPWFQDVWLAWIGFEFWFAVALFVPYASGVLWSVQEEWRLAAQILKNFFNQIFDGFFTWFQGFLMDKLGNDSAAAFAIPTMWTPFCFIICVFLFTRRQNWLGLGLFEIARPRDESASPGEKPQANVKVGEMVELR